MRKDVIAMFDVMGFASFDVRYTTFEIAGREVELDGLYVFDNIIVICEETTATDKDHIRKKAELYQFILDDRQDETLEALRDNFIPFENYVAAHPYEASQYRFCFAYFAPAEVSDDSRARYSANIHFIDPLVRQYFLRLAKAIEHTARYEFFKFLGLKLADIGHQQNSGSNDVYEGLQIPETPSGFPRNFFLVSFLASPESLLKRAYVLRADSWMDADALYQRLLVRSKLVDMRKYLTTSERVFVNNLIVSLPAKTRVTGTDGEELTASRTEMARVRVEIPKEFDTIGLIDGQHRVFSYHEGVDEYETKISALRSKQHLLVTGIIYPKAYSLRQRQRFEARLFLEINGTQKTVPPELKQAIKMMVDPFDEVAIAKAVVTRLAEKGPLSGKLSTHFFARRGKLRTASIVTYGLQQLVRPVSYPGSLFNIWAGAGKKGILNKTDADALERYIQFAVTEINAFLEGFRTAHEGLWTLDQRKSRALSTTGINGLIYCFRKIVEKNRLSKPEKYARAFAHMAVSFSPALFSYKSSHWAKLGNQLFEDSFSGWRAKTISRTGSKARSR